MTQPYATIIHKHKSHKSNCTKFHQQSTRDNSHTNPTAEVEITMRKSSPTSGSYNSCGGNLGELKQRVLAQFRVAELQDQLLRRRHLLILGCLAHGGAAAAASHRRGGRRRDPGEGGGNVRHLNSTARLQRNIDHHTTYPQISNTKRIGGKEPAESNS